MLKRARPRKEAVQSKTDVLFIRANEMWDCGRLHSALRLFISGAKSGDSSAQHNLGYFYDVGIGVKPNRAKALYWYKKAVRRGSRVAASNIGTIFRDEGDIKQALSWFNRAVDLGDADANLEIAKIYLSKKNNLQTAVDYLKRTTTAGRDDVTEGSKQEARRLLKQLDGKPRGRRVAHP
jgi:TPR repeat protein